MGLGICNGSEMKGKSLSILQNLQNLQNSNVEVTHYDITIRACISVYDFMVGVEYLGKGTSLYTSASPSDVQPGGCCGC